MQTQVEQEDRLDNETSDPSSATLLSYARACSRITVGPATATVLITGETGTGGLPEHRAGLFEPFFTTKRGNKKRASASGSCVPLR